MHISGTYRTSIKWFIQPFASSFTIRSLSCWAKPKHLWASQRDRQQNSEPLRLSLRVTRCDSIQARIAQIKVGLCGTIHTVGASLVGTHKRIPNLYWATTRDCPYRKSLRAEMFHKKKWNSPKSRLYMIVYMISLVTLSLSKGLGALLTVYSFLCSTQRPFDKLRVTETA